MAKLETLQDDFDDGVIDSGKWAVLNPTQWSETTTLNCLFKSSGSSSGYVTSNSFYDVTESSFSFKLEYTGTIGNNRMFVSMSDNANAINLSSGLGLAFFEEMGVKKLRIGIFQPGSWYAYTVVTSYNPISHPYIKVRFDTTNMCIDGSSDGITYTNLLTETIYNVNVVSRLNLDLTNVKLEFFKYIPNNITPAVDIQISNLNHTFTNPKCTKLRGKCKVRAKTKLR